MPPRAFNKPIVALGMRTHGRSPHSSAASTSRKLYISMGERRIDVVALTSQGVAREVKIEHVVTEASVGIIDACRIPGLVDKGSIVTSVLESFDPHSERVAAIFTVIGVDAIISDALYTFQSQEIICAPKLVLAEMQLRTLYDFDSIRRALCGLRHRCVVWTTVASDLVTMAVLKDAKAGLKQRRSDYTVALEDNAKRIIADAEALEAKLTRIYELGDKIAMPKNELEDIQEGLADTTTASYGKDILEPVNLSLSSGVASIWQLEVSEAEMCQRALSTLRAARKLGSSPSGMCLDFTELALTGKKVSFDEIIEMVDELVAQPGKEYGGTQRDITGDKKLEVLRYGYAIEKLNGKLAKFHAAVEKLQATRAQMVTEIVDARDRTEKMEDRVKEEHSVFEGEPTTRVPRGSARTSSHRWTPSARTTTPAGLSCWAPSTSRRRGIPCLRFRPTRPQTRGSLARESRSAPRRPSSKRL